LVFMSTERLEPCQKIYDGPRVTHGVHLDYDFGKPVVMSYHTRHTVSDTGRLTLREGYEKGHDESIIDILYLKPEKREIEPIIIGGRWVDYSRNENGSEAVWYGHDYGEILPEDIQEFARLAETKASSADEWMSVMKELPERQVKEAFAALLKEPSKSDWGGEE